MADARRPSARSPARFTAMSAAIRPVRRRCMLRLAAGVSSRKEQMGSYRPHPVPLVSLQFLSHPFCSAQSCSSLLWSMSLTVLLFPCHCRKLLVAICSTSRTWLTSIHGLHSTAYGLAGGCSGCHMNKTRLLALFAMPSALSLS